MSRPAGGYSGPMKAGGAGGAARAIDAASRAPIAIRRYARMNFGSSLRFPSAPTVSCAVRVTGGPTSPQPPVPPQCRRRTTTDNDKRGSAPMEGNLDAINHVKTLLLDAAVQIV